LSVFEEKEMRGVVEGAVGLRVGRSKGEQDASLEVKKLTRSKRGSKKSTKRPSQGRHAPKKKGQANTMFKASGERPREGGKGGPDHKKERWERRGKKVPKKNKQTKATPAGAGGRKKREKETWNKEVERKI